MRRALLDRPLVHGPWTHAWWRGDRALAECFGEAPTFASLEDTAAALDASRFDWRPALARHDLPEDGLVVLAGQQPVLAGGPGFVAHKAATAIRLAALLEERWRRPVRAVFLIATDDHDSSEIDHIDYISTSTGSLSRVSCAVRPGSDSFHRSVWDSASLAETLVSVSPGTDFDDFLNGTYKVPEHFLRLLRATYRDHDLHQIEAHRLNPAAREIIERALREGEGLCAELRAGAARLSGVDMPASFDPQDPRPLVLESRAGRRRRLPAGDDDALARLAEHFDDFSPQAALRPIVQAAALPVVAQVVGPSETLYLGQARGLHDYFDVVPPVLVPRLEATRVSADELSAIGDEPSRAADLLDGPEATRALRSAEASFVDSARAFGRHVEDADAGLQGKVRRWLEKVEQGAHRLAEAPTWRGSGAGRRLQALRPRGRPQDTVLAWVPDAWSADDPAGWGSHIVSLSAPLEPPRHVLHAYPSERDDG